MLWSLLLACADAGFAMKTADAAAEDSPSSYDDATDTEGAATGAEAAPTHWTLRGDLVVRGGVLDASASTMTLLVVDPTTQARACEVALALEAVVLAERDAFAPWWTGLSTAAGACAAVPTSLSVGAGPLLAELRARMAASGLSDATDARGAYVQVEGGEPLAVGVFAPAGLETADTASPSEASDLRWTLTPMFAVAIAATETAR